MAILKALKEVFKNIIQLVKIFKIEKQKNALKKLQIQAYLKQNNAPIAKYDENKIKAPTMKEINT